MYEIPIHEYYKCHFNCSVEYFLHFIFLLNLKSFKICLNQKCLFTEKPPALFVWFKEISTEPTKLLLVLNNKVNLNTNDLSVFRLYFFIEFINSENSNMFVRSAQRYKQLCTLLNSMYFKKCTLNSIITIEQF